MAKQYVGRHGARRRTVWCRTIGLERIVRRKSDGHWTNQGRNDGAAVRNVVVVAALLLLRRCCCHGVAIGATLLLERATALLVQRCCWSVLRRYCCNIVIGARYDATAATFLLQHATTLMLPRRCYCNGAAALRLKFLVFFYLLDSFRRENESEKEKKEQDSKPVSRLYWLA